MKTIKILSAVMLVALLAVSAQAAMVNATLTLTEDGSNGTYAKAYVTVEIDPGFGDGLKAFVAGMNGDIPAGTVTAPTAEDGFMGAPNGFLTTFVNGIGSGFMEMGGAQNDDPSIMGIGQAGAVDLGWVWYALADAPTVFEFSGNMYGGEILAVDVSTTIVPEPATMLLLGLGGVAAIRRRRKS